ncbi:MAG TPA: ricin-type beta-trefoil lectin domain protein, partial [Streptosporangiaceae bacterium]|nr:ricin-type beta-trefoil lectin domain protein [Streptosporangiaceae bacterium]
SHTASAARPASTAQAARVTAAVAPGAVPGPPSGWSTVFSDDFNGAAGSGPSASWMYDTGPGSSFGTGEIETMTNSPANVHLDGNGNLDITALGSGSSWTSGRIQTTTASVGAPAGGELEVTASIEQPNPASGLGYWPAFWMLGPGQWPENGEIDILEDVNALSEHSGTLHCGTDPGGPCNETNGIGSGLQGCSGCQTGYHTYTVIVNRTDTSNESVTWYLDGNQFFTVSEGQVGAATWQAAVDHNFSIIFDLAMGGGYPNGVCGCSTPTGSTSSGATMSVAYVAAYSTSGGSSPPPSGATGPITGYGGLCVDDRSASTANFNPVQVYTCNGTAAQQWTVVTAGSTLHALGKCMDIKGGGTADGTTVDLYDCNNTAAQVFIPESNGSLYNPQSGKCLDDTNWSTTPGTQLQIWDCTGNANQKWNLP